MKLSLSVQRLSSEQRGLDSFRLGASFSILLLLAVCCGCGTSAYEEQVAKRTAEMARAKAIKDRYKDLAPPQSIPGTNLSISMIKKFGNPAPWCIQGKLPDGNPADPRRAEPGKLKLPVPILITYEGPVEANDQKLPVYCYVGVGPTPAAGIAGVISQMQRDYASLGEVSPPRPFSVDAINGESKNWTEIHCKGNQEFFCLDKNNKGSFNTLPGVFAVFLHDEDGQLIVVAARMPEPIETGIGGPAALSQWGALVVGSIVKR